MGALQAMEMADLAGFEQGLRWHLQSNHFPPVAFMFDIVKEAVENVAAHNAKKTVSTEGTVTHRIHGTQVPSDVIVEGYHAWVFVDALQRTGEFDVLPDDDLHGT